MATAGDVTAAMCAASKHAVRYYINDYFKLPANAIEVICVAGSAIRRSTRAAVSNRLTRPPPQCAIQSPPSASKHIPSGLPHSRSNRSHSSRGPSVPSSWSAKRYT